MTGGVTEGIPGSAARGMTEGAAGGAARGDGPVRLLLVECEALGAPEDGTAATGERLRRFAEVVEALCSVCPWVEAVRPGVCAFPMRGPRRWFGGEEAVAERVEEVVRATLGPAATASRTGTPDTAEPRWCRLGVAEGVFAAALAARVGERVPEGETPLFLAPWHVEVLGDPDLAGVLVRLGLSTLGRFAALPAADVLARFGAGGARCQRVARGLEGELPGYRVPGMPARLTAALGRALAPGEHQGGFWGGVSAADERAAEVLVALQRRLGPEAVAVPVLEGGRGPGERCRLVPWQLPGARGPEAEGPGAKRPGGRGPRGSASRGIDPPWPARLPPPAPATVAPVEQRGGARTAEVTDERGVPVGVTGRGVLEGVPARLSLDGGLWMPLVAWSAPWPCDERWWSRARRRVARMQVLTEDGRAYLLVTEHGRWRLEAVYD